ncbi:5'-3' DNA helicase [Fusarium globosum]|uniref:5'-3' DNA helicase n=1 Tax=Fusarium globosum TaxID=78864 RepID=A0A8H6DF78_9HYPO|nr:5'-3' DNA helicase [Fusarium globosum]
MRGPAPRTFPQRDTTRAPLKRKLDTNAQAPISASEPKRLQRSSSFISIPSSSDEDEAPKAKSHGKAEAITDSAAKATADRMGDPPAKETGAPTGDLRAAGLTAGLTAYFTADSTAGPTAATAKATSHLTAKFTRDATAMDTADSAADPTVATRDPTGVPTEDSIADATAKDAAKDAAKVTADPTTAIADALTSI